MAFPPDTPFTAHVTPELKFPVPETVAAHWPVFPVGTLAEGQVTLTEVIVGEEPPPPPPPLLEPPPQATIKDARIVIEPARPTGQNAFLSPKPALEESWQPRLNKHKMGQDSLVHSSAPAVTSPLKRLEPDLTQNPLSNKGPKDYSSARDQM